MENPLTQSTPSARPTFQRLRSVTLPVLKLEKGKARYIALLGPMHLGKKLDDTKEAATLCRAIDMTTGEEGLIICTTVFAKELNENYPGEAYVGRGFEVIITHDPEKKYNHVSICEVSIPEEIEATIAALSAQALKAPAVKAVADTKKVANARK